MCEPDTAMKPLTPPGWERGEKTPIAALSVPVYFKEFFKVGPARLILPFCIHITVKAPFIICWPQPSVDQHSVLCVCLQF